MKLISHAGGGARRPSIVFAFLLVLHSCTTVVVSSLAAGEAATVVPSSIRWASTGGGWRSMVACMGFANVFRQAGLLGEDSSKFSAVSTTSGASWFSTQLFYSSQFYNAVVFSSPDDLYDFVTSWMDSYLAMSINVTQHEICNVTSTDLNSNTQVKLEIFSQLCDLVHDYDGDWTALIDDMFRHVSTDYGDETFADRLAGSDNRVPPLQGTDLLIQTALSPTSRIRSTGTAGADADADAGAGADADTAVYLGPNGGTEGDLHSVPLSAAYIVSSLSDDDASSSSTTTGFRYALSESSDSLIAYNAPTSSNYSMSDWADFHLFPGTDGTVEIDSTFVSSGNPGPAAAVGRPFREPFGGPGPVGIVQVASASSAAAASSSGLLPSVFSQSLSEDRYIIETNDGPGPVGEAKLSAFDSATDRIYRNPYFDNTAVCSQWPEPCGDADGFFVDGWLADNPALAINIGQYQTTSTDADAAGQGETVKVILTNTNKDWNAFDHAQILMYFSTTFNQDVEPGAFLWAPEHIVPFRSPQIFQDYLDGDSLDALLEPVQDSNMSTAVLTATTTDNAPFGIKAGQSVEILLINLNEDITTYVVLPPIIEYFTVPLAEMARDIASNEDLLSRVQDFVATGPTHDFPNATLSPSPSVTSPGTAPPVAPITDKPTSTPESPPATSTGFTRRLIYPSTVTIATVLMLLMQSAQGRRRRSSNIGSSSGRLSSCLVASVSICILLQLSVPAEAAVKRNVCCFCASSVGGDETATFQTGHNLEWLASNLAESKFRNIVLLNGAGVSVSAGIPDFRTPGTGLYDKLDKYNLPFPEAIFELSYFRDNPRPFVEIAKELWPGQTGGPTPTLAHCFVALLEKKGYLRRVYTQNIDGLEGLAGVSEEKLVECHGHFRSCSCTSPQCGARVPNIKECRDTILGGEAYRCPECGSLAKPDIVFFGETLPSRFQDLIDEDVARCDLLIVMGTSLLVAPVASIPEWVGRKIPRLLINRELVGDFAKDSMMAKNWGGGHTRDIFEEGDCDHGVRRLCQLAGADWEKELDQLHEMAMRK